MKRFGALPLLALTGALMSCGVGSSDLIKPSVMLKASPNSLTSRGNITLTAEANDNQGIAKVEFYDGGILISTDTEAPYVASINYTPESNGIRTFKAIAYDMSGNTSDAIATANIAIRSATPIISVSSSKNIIKNSEEVILSADSSDNTGISKVEFYDNGKLIASDTTSPYSATVSYTSKENGLRVITAKAYNAEGNSSAAEAQLNVDINPVAPSVSVSSSRTTVTRSNPFTLSAVATDDIGISKVEFYDNGKLIGESKSAPYIINHSYSSNENGVHTIVAKAYDESGNTNESSISIKVEIDNVSPTISLTASTKLIARPQNIIFNAVANDNIAVDYVDFYDNGKLVFTDTLFPYMWNASYGFDDNGEHTVIAKAYDASGNTTSASATVTVAIADRNEPNDSVAAATALTVGTPVKGAVAAQGRDYDYFKFTAKAGDPLKLTVKTGSVDPKSTLDPYVMILMPDGKTVLEKDDDGGSAMESEIRFNVPVDGTYTVVLTSFNIHNDATATDDLATNTYELLLSRR